MNTTRRSRPPIPLDSLEGPALPLPAAEVERMARAIAHRAASRDSAVPSGRRHTRLAGLGWRVGVGVAIVTGSAAAVHWMSSRGAHPVSEDPGAKPAAASVRVPGPRMAQQAEPASTPTIAPMQPLSPAASPEAGPSESGARSISTEPSGVPAQLLAHANGLRRAQQWAAAATIYEQVIRQFPASAEAYSAKVAAASLRLEKLGDPAAARRLFQQALRSPGSGALDEEILWGLARADRAAGDPRAERATLERLLALHPRTLHAPYARARLRELTPESQ
jgi:hypothetical protein